MGTGLNFKVPPEQLAVVWTMPEIRKALKSTAQGAATTVWAATAKVWEGKGGKLLENVQESQPFDEAKGPASLGYAKHAYDEVAAKRLWEESLKMVGLE